MRILLVFLLLGTLALFAIQNLSPLSIVFFGARTQALPLAVWIIVAIASGAIVSGLLQFFSYLQQRPLRSRIRKLEKLEAESTRSNWRRRETGDDTQQTPYTPPPPPPPETKNTESYEDDWEEDTSTTDDDEWDFEEKPAAADTSPQNFPEEDRTRYEVRQEPKSASRAGSVYSYSYREPKNSGVGKTEAVYDANYRVITPPYQPPTPETNQDEDDWGFEDEDEDNFEDDWRSDKPRA
ncbi:MULTISPECIES: LapA family protein [Cyanophyceae]|uniref:LapA family protein n=1 Tax=Cyanophyceae TaxID=3028117 RepID=UPI0016868192|nr:LapA family protein [Trichocoleus sp. FACHB-40]MBD2004814.1 LapA family protein [Trichocoleus sp. FACHB-40]